MPALGPPDSRAARRDALFRRWALSPSRAKQIAAAWGRELVNQDPGQEAVSSYRIAARFNVSNTTAVRAREFLAAAGIIAKRAGAGRYHVV
jgi:hypothetical protein